MRIMINLKQLGKKGRRVKPVPFFYNRCPGTVEELIEATVDLMLQVFREKQEATKEDAVPEALAEETIRDMAEIGRVAFGFVYNETVPDRKKAVETALLAYRDGLVRVFVNGEEAEVREGKTPLQIAEDDEVTFVRLAMLAGRMW